MKISSPPLRNDIHDAVTLSWRCCKAQIYNSAGWGYLKGEVNKTIISDLLLELPCVWWLFHGKSNVSAISNASSTSKDLSHLDKVIPADFITMNELMTTTHAKTEI